jgi:hypothetical protein
MMRWGTKETGTETKSRVALRSQTAKILEGKKWN